MLNQDRKESEKATKVKSLALSFILPFFPAKILIFKERLHRWGK
ncbi:hypothetical protein [Sulfurospirillum deleyianum]|uniref:Uncharacterized protein n=1 Tax=Sulfurospirillum deleyianum (strain ATCC 51133 / DSM 6946 / 5175) TaxID=525898 RepID=D1B1P9_SULD5|nr:hypothetical protein [Sulfurospirillum deleyianum]ACZ12019.1 hypothetical protein Sdel_0990 [Sulfurospirillum deleyianum DSM 6946]